MGARAVRMLRETADGAPQHKLARDQQVVAGLSRAIAAFIERLNRDSMSPESARDLPDVLRIARYYETVAELALEAAAAGQEAAGPGPVGSDAFAVQAKSLLDAADPEAAPDERRPVRLGLQALEEDYQALKSRLLEAGAQGRMPVAEMDARLRTASTMRRAIEQAVKAVLLLDSRDARKSSRTDD